MIAQASLPGPFVPKGPRHGSYDAIGERLYFEV